MTTFKEFMSLVDSELRQGETLTRAVIPDSYRLARESEVKEWINQSIGPMMVINSAFWERIIEFTPMENSAYIEVPYHIRKLKRIYSDGVWHHIFHSTNQEACFWWEGGRKITANKGSFVAGGTIKLDGTLRRDKIIDDNSEIDFPDDHLRLLLLSVLLKRSSRDEHKKALWYAERQELLVIFKADIGQVEAISTTEPIIGFGL